MSGADLSADDLVLPIKRTDGETLEDRLTANAYHNILPARYLRKDHDGDLVESQEDLFVRVAKNIALAEAVFEADRRGIEVTVTPDQLKPDHPRRDELAREVFGAGTTATDDVETALSVYNVNKFAYDTVVPELPEEVRDHVKAKRAEFQDLMENLSFVPNSPTLMNAGDELQQLSACFVDSPEDDLTDIHQTAKEAAEVFQCLTADATVRVTGKGTVSIVDVEPGDEIVQRDGESYRTKQVEEVHAYDDAPTRRLETESGIEITGTRNHRLLVNGEWTELDDVSEGDTVSVRLGWLAEENRTVSLETVPSGAGWADARTVSNEAIASLHADGLSDYEIAERLDASSSTVQRRRADELGLSPNGQGGRSKGRSFDEDEFESLYDAGHTDSEIAEELGTTAATVGSFRRAGDLETNGRPVKTVTQPAALSEDLAELVGLWIGDGSVHEDGIRFHVSRESVLETLDRRTRDLFDTGLDWTWADGCYEAVIHSHEIKRWWLANFGDAKPSSAEARVPDPVQRGDRSIAVGFLRGLFTADGTLTKGKYPRLDSASDKLVGDTVQLLLGAGIPANRWDWANEDRDYSSVAPVGREGLVPFAERVGFLDDRTETLQTAVSNGETRPIGVGAVDGSTWDQSVVTIEDAGEDTVYDVTVADDPEYVANGLVSHNSGGGMGYAFWRLRPYGDAVGSTGGIASGPITFMRTFDQMCETIAQGGARRGAQMGVMRISHPDVIEFIHAKNKDVSLAHCLRLNDPDDYTYTTFSEALAEARELIDDDGKVPKHLRNAVEGHLSNFNISVGVTDAFMEALEAGEEFTFTNPRTGEPHIASEETKEMYSRYGLGEHIEVGEPLSVDPQLIWDRIVDGAHENGEPGVVFLERINNEHSFDVEEHPDHRILATNPCGEQPLEEYEACNLGHINLSTLAAEDAPDWRVWSREHEFDTLKQGIERFLEEALDTEEFGHRIETGTRFLENVVTMSDFPVEKIEQKVREMRKIGLGIMGLAQLYIQLGIPYGSEQGNEVARQVMRRINHGSKWASHELAAERGTFEEWADSKYATPTEYREWFERQTGESADDWADGFPIRNHNTTTIAPTGTTSMVGNTTGGCEPIYNVAYYKNVSDDVQGDEMLVEFDDYFLRTLEANDIDVEAVKEEAQEQMATNAFDGVDGLSTVPDAIGELFVVTSDLSGKQHAAVQCACQEGVDSAISKTCNFPNDATKADMDEVYRYIYEHGGKGVTVYRDGTRSKQVLTTRAENTEFSEDMDPDEAAAFFAEQIEEIFGGIEGFLDHDAVEEALGADLGTLLDADESTPTHTYAEKQARPDLLHGVTQRIDTGYGKLYVTINEDTERERPFELFATIGNSGGFTASFTEALAKTISTALRSGVDPNEIAGELRGIRSPKVAWDKGEQINSIPDAIGTALQRYLDDEIDKPYPQQQSLSEAASEGATRPEPETDADPNREADRDPIEPETDGGAAAATQDATESLVAAGESPECPDCGAMSLAMNEGCKTCQSCGWSEC